MITFQCQFVNLRLLLNVRSLRLLSDNLNCPLSLVRKISPMLKDGLLRLSGDVLNRGGSTQEVRWPEPEEGVRSSEGSEYVPK